LLCLLKTGGSFSTKLIHLVADRLDMVGEFVLLFDRGERDDY
jgi:hypothetical protein